jgi:hypothetical protein
MKFKPVYWLILFMAIGLAVWLHRHPAKPPGAKSKPAVQTVEQRIQQAKKFNYNQVHSTPNAVVRETISATLQPVVNAMASYPERAAAVRTITTTATVADFNALYSFLLTKSPEDDDQNGQVLKNQLMDVLCALNPPPAQLADVLAQIYHDRNQNEALRDYAMQHLATFHQQLNGASEEMRRIKSFEMAEAENVLWEGLSETDNSIAGTALLGLLRLAQSEPGYDEQAVAQAALNLARDNGAGELARITALQVCAKLQVTDALPLVMNAAQPTQTVPLRISAVGALGVLGGAEQVAFLDALIQGADERLKLPAQHALNQINQRLGPISQGH